MFVRKQYSPAFRAKVALAALSGDKTLSELNSEFQVHQSIFFSTGLREEMTVSRRREFLDRSPEKPLSLQRQCRLLSVSRSGVDYSPRGESELNLSLMRQMDEIFLEYPFFGTRQMTRFLNNNGRHVSRERITRLMRVMGLQALYQGPKTTDPNQENTKYPSTMSADPIRAWAE